MCRIPLLLALAIGLGACVRAGFGVTDDAAPFGDGSRTRRDLSIEDDGARAVDGSGSDGNRHRFDGSLAMDRGIVDAPRASIRVTASNDSCSNPRSISLSSTPIAVEVDTTGAGDDFSFSGCVGVPDVVLRLSGSETLYLNSCWGGGSYAFEAHNTCLNPTSVQGGAGGCTGMGPGFTYAFGFDPFYLVVCRDPAQGPATLLIGGGPPN